LDINNELKRFNLRPENKSLNVNGQIFVKGVIHLSSQKINILIPIYAFGRTGGIKVLSQLSNYWIKEGHQVSFLVFRESQNPYFPVNANIIWINEKGEEAEGPALNFSLKNSGYKRMIALYKYLKKNSKNYDVVLANYNLTAWPVWLGSKTNNFYYIQAYEPEFYEQKTLKALVQKSLAMMTYYLPLKKVVNAEIYKNYKKLHSNFVVLPGLDLNIYTPKVSMSFSQNFVVGCIGRKEEWKGSNDVGKAIDILRDKGYQIDFKVAFEPIDCDEYELLKPDGDENLSDFYKSLDVLIAPGHIQLGAVHYPVIEAMACKTTVITTGYYPATENNSYIVPVKRPDMIAEKIIDIMNNPELAKIKSEKAYQDIQQFEWGIVSQKFINLFQGDIK
jgi:glycosyltransferase involved in cell wall biosynthesis